ncbi:MAG: carbohydrate ABC transporter permease [Clostridiaceae bacterium]
MKNRVNSTTVLKYLYIYILAVLVTIPIINVALCAFKTNEEINRVISLPSSFYLDNFVTVFQNKNAMWGILNSLIITAASLLIVVILSSIASYGIARRREAVFGFIFLYFLSAMMIPAVVNTVSLYTLLNRLDMIDKRTGLILIYSAQSIPMGVLMYAGFIKTVPRELDEAAIIDGCGYIRRFLKVILPLLKPTITAQVVISSLSIWNDFFLPLLFIRDSTKKPLTLAVYTFTSEHSADWGGIYAMLVVAILPPVIIFLSGQKYFYQGISTGALKG